MSEKIDDLKRLQTHIRTLISLRTKQAKASGRDYFDMTPKQAQKACYDAAWLGMEIDKVTREAHAAAVDCGIADPRSLEMYGPVYYRPSGFHHYRHNPTKPRCIDGVL